MALLDILGKIGFDWQVALANLINFLIIFWILKRFAFAPIKKTIQARQERINQGLSRASEADQRLDTAKEEAEAILNDARSEADLIVSEARRRHDHIITEAERTGTNKVETILENGRKTIEHERTQMERELKQKTIGLITAGVQKIIDEEVDEQRARQLTASIMK